MLIKVKQPKQKPKEEVKNDRTKKSSFKKAHSSLLPIQKVKKCPQYESLFDISTDKIIGEIRYLAT